MGITKLRSDTRELGQPVPVPQPVGQPVPTVRTQVETSSSNARTRNGVWECSPGKFRRVVTQAEFCHFLEGDCTFTPDGGDLIEIKPGDVCFFPPNSKGVWDIRTTTRKVFVVFDDQTAT